MTPPISGRRPILDVEVDPLHEPEFFEFAGHVGDGSEPALWVAVTAFTDSRVVGEAVRGAGEEHRPGGVREQQPQA